MLLSGIVLQPPLILKPVSMKKTITINVIMILLYYLFIQVAL